MERVLTLLKSGGLFLFFLQKNHSIKNYTDGFFKERLLRKNGPFSGSIAEKKFFCGVRSRARVDGCDGGCACLI